MDEWKKSFVEKLSQVQSRWATQFDEALDEAAAPVFSELSAFLRENGFVTTMPMHEKGRHSYKFELAEDAYVLLIFRSRAVGEFELSREIFVLGLEPQVRRSTERLSSLNEKWVRREFQSALTTFVELLAQVQAPIEQEVVVN